MTSSIVTGRNARTSQTGSALPFVLILVTALALTATAFVQSTRYEGWAIRNDSAAISLDHIAYGGVQRAMADLVSQTPLISRDGAPYQLYFGDALVTISVTDEKGKIDLNRASSVMLTALIEVVAREAGIDINPEVVAADIIDQRTSRNRQRNFRAIDELITLPSINEQLFLALSPYITISSYTQQINAAYASEIVLRATPGISSSDIERIIAARARGETSLQQIVSPWLTTVEGPFYKIRAQAQRPNGVRSIKEVVVWRKENELPSIIEARSVY